MILKDFFMMPASRLTSSPRLSLKRLRGGFILLALATLIVSGCVYKINISQGNYLEAKTIEQVKEGMTLSLIHI